MKHRFFSAIKYVAATLAGFGFLLGSIVGCTRDDIAEGALNNKSASISFGAQTSGSLTKGTGTAVENLGYQELGAVDGETLYLRAERTLWDDNAAATTKVTPYTSAMKLKEEGVSLAFAAYTLPLEDSPVDDWTLYGDPQEATYSSTDKYWIPTTPLSWPNVGKYIRFFAYAPYNSSLSFTAPPTSEPTLTGFQVETTLADQKDLLYARDVVLDKNPNNVLGVNVPHILTLEHALAAIRFKVVKRTPAVKVSSLKVKNVFEKGDFNLYTGVWSNRSTLNNEFTINNPETEDRGDANYLYFKDEYTLMMVPNVSGDGPAQENTNLPPTAEIEIHFENGSVINAKINTHQWRAGYALTYVIDNMVPELFDYKFIATPEPKYYDATTSTEKDMDYTGTTVRGTVISYKQLPSTSNPNPNPKIPVGWTIEGYYTTEDGANTANFNKRIRRGINGAFISAFEPIKGSGSTDDDGGEAYVVTHPKPVPKANSVIIDEGSVMNRAIANNTEIKGNEDNPWNLSNPNGGDEIIETANTYIINGKGWYRFPIVMGNGVKDGNLNTVAYQQDGFVDYLGNAISDPFLRGNAPQKAPAAAYLVWEDKPNYLSNDSRRIDEHIIDIVDYSKPFAGKGNADISGYYLSYPGSINGIKSTGEGLNTVYWVHFKVTQATKQGLSHIAVKDTDGRTMWSWLIWLTSYELGKNDVPVRYLYNSDPDSPDETLKSASFMKYPLGWVDDGYKAVESYDGDAVYVRLIQSENPDPDSNWQVIKLVRPAADDVVVSNNLGYAPFYQWGRPAPMQPGVYKNGFAREHTDEEYGGFHRRMGFQAALLTIPDAILNSHSYITSAAGGSWLTGTDELIKGLWSAGNKVFYTNKTIFTDDVVVKTIYDPCPVGYTVPRFNAFTAFNVGKAGVITDASVNPPKRKADQWDNYYNSSNRKTSFERGLVSHTTWRRTFSEQGVGEIYFPALGYRHWATGLVTVGYQQGLYWIAVSRGRAQGASFNFQSINAFPQHRDAHAFGATIIPQREE